MKKDGVGQQTNKEKFVFKAQHFYDLLEKQGYRCPISGRELTPENTTAEHIVPLRKSGEHALANIALVDHDASRLKRYLTDEEVISLAADIVRTMGKEHGYGIRQIKPR